MNNRYILFFNSYHSINRNYTLCSLVKYKIKREDNNFYYTIKDIRIAKKLEDKKYIVGNYKG